MIKAFIKKIIKKLPVAFTQNQKYDKQTREVIRRLCHRNSNCIDVGCHKGEILDVILKYAPEGTHYAFEPIPMLYNRLLSRYHHLANVHIYELALSNTKASSNFNYVISNPSYSGLKRRAYDRPNENDTVIHVQTDLLDHIIPWTMKIDLIKIDVEGGEMGVLEGAVKTIQRCRPVILFEHGKGGSEFYGTTPEKIFSFLENNGLQVSLLERWLNHEKALTLDEFQYQYDKLVNFFFIAYPPGIDDC